MADPKAASDTTNVFGKPTAAKAKTTKAKTTGPDAEQADTTNKAGEDK